MKRTSNGVVVLTVVSVFLPAEGKDLTDREREGVKRHAGPATGPAGTCGLTCIGNVRHRRSEEISGSPWGVSCHWITDKHDLTTEQQLEQLATLGAKWGFLVPNWDLIETRKGTYDWNGPAHRLDDAVHGMVRRKISPIIQIYGGNRLYTPVSPVDVPPGVEVPKLTTDSQAKKAWFAWIEALVRRYCAHVKVWEVWNEPNTEWFWKPKPDPQLYGRMVKEVAQIVRSVDSQAIILAGSTAHMPLDFLRGFLESEGADSFNFWSVHPYADRPEQTEDDIRRVQEVLASYKKSPVVWQSECGFPSNADTAGWGYGGPWDEVKHAKWLLRRFLCDASIGMKVSIYFVLNDYPALLEGGPRKGRMGINRKGLHSGESWERKPAAHAFANLAALIDDRFETKRLRLDFAVVEPGPYAPVSARNLRTCTYIEKQTGAPMICYWLDVPMRTETKAGTIRLGRVDQEMRQPVLVDLLDGRVYEAVGRRSTDGSIVFDALPLADSPLVLCSASVVPLSQTK